MCRLLLRSLLFPYTTLFRSDLCLVLLLAVLLLLLLVAPCLNCLEAVKKPPPNNLDMAPPARAEARSEERFSRNAETDLVCRLLLEKKKKKKNKQEKYRKKERKMQRRTMIKPIQHESVNK